MNEVANLIGNLGFPIVCCLGLVLFAKYIYDKGMEKITEIMDLHISESERFAQALDRNTAVLEKFLIGEGETE